MQWSFENFILDTDNAALWQDGEQVALRPKTFDVLRYLIENAGDLVRKETLLEEVWENSYVVEGVLTTSMSELRKDIELLVKALTLPRGAVRTTPDGE